jgi:hypothetical protein
VAEIPTTPEVAEFVANLLRGTRAGAVEWRQDQDRQLVAGVGNEYRVLLQQIPDLDGNTNDPDHTITLVLKEQRLFTLNRLDLSAEELRRALGEPVEYSFQVFRELWDRAFLNATRMDGHLSNVNRTLGQQIKATTERRSSSPKE